MAVVVNGKQFVTLSDEFFVNGAKVYKAFANGVQVYPDDEGGKTSDLITLPFKKPIRFGSGTGIGAGNEPYFYLSTTCRIASCMKLHESYDNIYNYAIVAAADHPFTYTRFINPSTMETKDAISFEHDGKTVYYTGLNGATVETTLYPGVFSEHEEPWATSYWQNVAWTIIYGRNA